MADPNPAGLDVVGQLLVDLGGSSIRVEALGDRIKAEVPDLRSGASMLRAWSKGRGRRESIRRLHDALVAAGLTLEVAIRGATLGVLGLGARPGLVSRWLGLGRMEVRVGGLIGRRRARDARPGSSPK